MNKMFGPTLKPPLSSRVAVSRLLAAAWLMQAGRRWLSNGLTALRQPLRCPADKMDLPACFADGGVLVGLELGVVVRELVIQDGDGHAVEDDSEGDAS